MNDLFKEDAKKVLKVSVMGIFIFLLLVMGFNSYTIIGIGEKGLKFSKISGLQNEVLSEGINFKIPFVEKIIIADVKTQKVEGTIGSTSLDQQVVNTRYAVNVLPNSAELNQLYQEIGVDYMQKVVNPAIEESIKNAMAQFKAEDLIKSRDLVGIKAREILDNKLKGRHVIIQSVNILNIDFSAEYNRAIELKVTAEQESLKAQNDLKRIQIEAEQKVTTAQAQADSLLAISKAEAESTIIKAEAEAKAIDIQKEALGSQSEQILELRKIEKWDGALPIYSMGDNPNMLLAVK